MEALKIDFHVKPLKKQKKNTCHKYIKRNFNALESFFGKTNIFSHYFKYINVLKKKISFPNLPNFIKYYESFKSLIYSISYTEDIQFLKQIYSKEKLLGNIYFHFYEKYQEMHAEILII